MCGFLRLGAVMNRVMVIGDASSGKSTLADWLAARTGLPVHHLDQVYWMPDWTLRPTAEKLAMVSDLEAQDAWILDGHVSATFENRVARADTLIWLDLPVSARLWRVVCRTFAYRGRSRPDMPDGCVQRFDRNTLSLLMFIWQDRHAWHQRMADCRAMAGKGVAVGHLTSKRVVQAFQNTLVTGEHP